MRVRRNIWLDPAPHGWYTGGMPMCEKCFQLQEKIDRCRRLLALVTDQLTVAGISGLLKRYESERDLLHHESEPSR